MLKPQFDMLKPKCHPKFGLFKPHQSPFELHLCLRHGHIGCGVLWLQCGGTCSVGELQFGGLRLEGIAMLGSCNVG